MNFRNEWTEEVVLSLVENQVEESLHLDYKACGALQKTDRAKEEISKDVSSFANSDGGVIIYGVVEGKGDRKHLPERVDIGFNPSDISKEWLESIILSKINRRLDGVRVFPVELKSQNPGHFIYVVQIPQSKQSPHMASDKRFYKRFNFSAIPMEEYEIRDVMGRFTAPDLEIKSSVISQPQYQQTGEFTLDSHIFNNSSAPAHYARVFAYMDERIANVSGFYGRMRQIGRTDMTVSHGVCAVVKYEYLYCPPRIPIFGTDGFPLYHDELSAVILRLPISGINNSIKNSFGPMNFTLVWEIQSPGMEVRRIEEQIIADDLNVSLIRQSDKDVVKSGVV